MMNIWFVRSNGETAHNNPHDSSYVPNEPPIFPLKEFNYSQKCLNDGFARYGWPNTGDLREKNPLRLAPLSYSFNDLETRYKTYLTKFCSIKAGDLILIPADGQNRGDVHLGIALMVDRKKVFPYIEPRPNAYYYTKRRLVRMCTPCKCLMGSYRRWRVFDSSYQCDRRGCLDFGIFSG